MKLTKFKLFGGLFALLLAFLSLGTPLAQASHITVGAYAYTTHSVNQRYGPGTNYGIKRVLPQGAKVYVRSGPRNQVWYRVRYNGGSGYVHGKYLSRSSGGSNGGQSSGGNRSIYSASHRNLGFGPSSGARIDRVIASINRNSPLIGYGDHIVRRANQYGVDPLLIVQWQFESHMGTTGINSPNNGGNLTWGAAKPYAYNWGCYTGGYSHGHRWAYCPTMTRGISLWFNYVGVRYRNFSNLRDYARTYNPCWDSAQYGFICGTEYAQAIMNLLRRKV